MVHPRATIAWCSEVPLKAHVSTFQSPRSAILLTSFPQPTRGSLVVVTAASPSVIPPSDHASADEETTPARLLAVLLRTPLGRLPRAGPWLGTSGWWWRCTPAASPRR